MTLHTTHEQRTNQEAKNQGKRQQGLSNTLHSMKHWTLSTTTSKSEAATKGTYAKGEGSTKRAILRGLELLSFSEPSKAPSFSPSP